MKAYIGVGSNLGDRGRLIASARAELEKAGAQVVRAAPVYETAPVGGPPQGKFLNTVWEVETALEPRPLLEAMLAVEKTLGRTRTEPNAPRTIDLDLLFYEGRVIREPGLRVPHPRLQEREFVLRPLADLAPGLRHPESGKTVSELLEDAAHHSPK